MSLRLTITSYHKITPGQCSETTLDSGAMTIGRGVDNDWVLYDPERLVSSKHCVIKYKDDRYFLTDNSTNGVELINAGIRLRRGNSEPLQDGEIIRIGDYEISARIDLNVQLPGSDVSSLETANSFEALMAFKETPSSFPFEAPVRGGSIQDTVSDLFDFLAPSRVSSATRSDHVPAERHDFRPPSAAVISAPALAPAPAPIASVIPADWEPFSERPTPLASEPDPAVDSAQGASIDAEQVQPPRVTAEAVSVRSMDACQFDLFKAFLRGAGLETLQIDRSEVQAQMDAIGRSYRLMVEGLIDILRARSSLKGEFRMQQTLIRPLENNPLKFAPNADEALLLLLRHSNQAFMGPDQAIADSFNDLRAHQLAVMAGVEASIKALLKRFEPSELETRMGKPGVLSNLFGSCQAQYWQQFTKLYADISRDAEEDFQDLFGREFGRAYEEHSARLRRS